MFLTRRLKIFIVVALAAGVVVPAVMQLSGADLSASLAEFPLWTVLFPFLSYMLIYVVDALRLRIVLRQFGLSVNLKKRFVNGVIGAFYSNITPMAAGGQPAQIMHLTKCDVPGSAATAIILVRFTEYLVLSLGVTVFGLFYFRRYLEEMISSGNLGILLAGIGFGLYIALCTGLLIVVFIPGLEKKIESMFARSRSKKIAKFIEKVRRLSEALSIFRRKSLLLVAADFFLGVINLVLQVFSLWILLSFRTDVPGGFPAVFTAFVLLNTIAYFVPSPGGSGGIESAYTVFFSALIGTNIAVAVLVWRFGSYYLHIGFQMIISLFTIRRKKIENSNVELVLLAPQGRDGKIC